MTIDEMITAEEARKMLIGPEAEPELKRIYGLIRCAAVSRYYVDVQPRFALQVKQHFTMLGFSVENLHGGLRIYWGT